MSRPRALLMAARFARFHPVALLRLSGLVESLERSGQAGGLGEYSRATGGLTAAFGYAGGSVYSDNACISHWNFMMEPALPRQIPRGLTTVL